MPGPKIRPKVKPSPRSNVRPVRIKFQQRGPKATLKTKGQFQEFQKWDKYKVTTSRPAGQFRKVEMLKTQKTGATSLQNFPVRPPQLSPVVTGINRTLDPVIQSYWSGIPLPLFIGPMMLFASAWWSGLKGTGSGAPKIEKVIKNAPEAYASQLHNTWRQGRDLVPGAKAADGLAMREPRWKEVKKDDPSFQGAPENFRRIRMDRLDPVFEVDIANLDFARLPDKFKYENGEAAKGVVDIIQKALSKQPGQKEVVIDLETASDIVHKQWLERNGSWAPADQKLPYENLSEAEKQKDRDVFLGGVYLINKELSKEGVQIVTRDFMQAKEKLEGVSDLNLEEYYTLRKLYSYWGLLGVLFF